MELLDDSNHVEPRKMQELCRSRKKTFLVVVFTIMLYIAYRTTNFQPSTEVL